MRLHQIPDFKLPPDALKDFRLNAPSIVQFAFGDIAKINDKEWSDLQKFAYELRYAGKFKMPFQEVCYTYESTDNILGVNQHYIIRGSHIDDDHMALTCGWVDPRYDRFYYVHAVLGPVSPDGKEHVIEASCWPPNNPEYAHLVVDAMSIMARTFFVLTVLLSAKGIEITVEPAPVRSNKCRARKGRMPIGEIRTVHVRVGGVRYSVGGERQGHHASPRLHWRRGHLRLLPSGELTTVSPCLVGDVTRGEVKHAGYAVKVKQ